MVKASSKAISAPPSDIIRRHYHLLILWHGGDEDRYRDPG